MPGSVDSTSVRMRRTSAESSTISTRTRGFGPAAARGDSLVGTVFLPGSVMACARSEELDVAAATLAGEIALIAALALGDGGGLQWLQTAHANLAGLRKIDDAARIDVAEVLGRDVESLRPEVLADEDRVARSDVGHRGEDAPAAEQLDLEVLAPGAELEELVDQAFHGVAAVTRRESRRRVHPAVGAAATGVLGEHEVIHATAAEPAVGDAGRDARAEHGRDRLVVARDVELPGKHLSGPALRRRIPEA